MILRVLSFVAWLAVTALLTHAAHRLGASGTAPTIGRLNQDLAEARAKAGGGCGTVYMALWPDYACGLTGGAIPAVLRPILCTQAIQVYRQPDLGRLRSKMEQLGPSTQGLTLYEEKGATEKRLSVGWKAEVK